MGGDVKINAGDTAWMLVSTGLVMFMTPGLALFYGGMVRAKNVLAMLMQNFFCLGIVSVLWAVIAYSLAFGGTGEFIGNLDFALMNNTAKEFPVGVALAIPPLLYCVYQMMFAVITPALVSGAVADRMQFKAWVWFVGLWMILVYAPVAHWVFAPTGWLFKDGALDFAGGTVVHINAGIAALAAILVLGKRRGWPNHPMPPHNLPLTLIGAGILWFGWFGFNAGSALAGNGVAVQALVNTHLAASAAMLGWLAVEKLRSGHATTLGAASGAVAGLVAITPCAGFVGSMSAMYIGAIAGGVCMLAVGLKSRFGYDDSLDVIGVHLAGGLLGTLLLGLFADVSINGAGADGLLYGGGFDLLGKQALAAGSVMVYSFVVTLVIMVVLNKVLPGGVRVSAEDEETGLDLTQHSETGYALDRV
ncbi:MAG: ammonium transporter [Acidimicrobiia bacterium]|jgi:Amt family ammonium transporter|nr:ammonium transporter [Acidimicrobiia bacterium]